MACALRLGVAGKIRQLPQSLSCQTYHVSSAYGARSTAAEQMEAYWKKNRDRNRPLSPHLSIYKFHVPMTLSISNRITASVVTAAIYIGPLVYLAGSKDFAGYVDLIKSWGTVGTGLVGATKFSLAFCFSYHLWASVRHLVWDTARGLRIAQVYKSGYVVMAATLLLTAVLMYL